MSKILNKSTPQGTPRDLREALRKAVNEIGGFQSDLSELDLDRAYVVVDDYIRQKLTIEVLKESDEVLRSALLRLKNSLLDPAKS